MHGCSDTTIVLGAVGKVRTQYSFSLYLSYTRQHLTSYNIFRLLLKQQILFYDIFLQALRVEHCERVHVIAASKRVCIANCRECVFFLGVNQRPLIVGDNHKLQVKPLSLRSSVDLQV